MTDKEPIWAVCLYVEGGSSDGTNVIEFVRADSRESAVTQAVGLNKTGDEEDFQVTAAAQNAKGVVMYVVLIFNPEARGNYDGRTESYEAWERNPFEGIEVLALCATENEVNRIIATNDSPGRKFHYEEIGREFPVADDNGLIEGQIIGNDFGNGWFAKIPVGALFAHIDYRYVYDPNFKLNSDDGVWWQKTGIEGDPWHGIHKPDEIKG